MDASRFFDETDFQLLRELWVGSHLYFRSDRVSIGAAARAVGINKTTAFDRLEKWKTTGFCDRFSIDLDPGSFGLVGRHVQFHSKAVRPADAVRRAAAIDGVRAVIQYSGHWLGVTMYAPSARAADATVRHLRNVVQADDVLAVGDTQVDYPRTTPIQLTDLDARILSAMMGDSRQAPSEIGLRVGASTRAVERHLKRLREAEAYYVYPMVTYGLIRGIVTGSVAFAAPMRRRAAIVREALGARPRIFLQQLDAKQYARVGVYAPTVGELDEQADAIFAQRGVRRLFYRLYTGIEWAPGFREWVLPHIANRVTGEGGARRRGMAPKGEDGGGTRHADPADRVRAP
ncbi:MAG: winged helix-turn-helix transcriptional regulator [Thermoplasmatota archaeon]